MNQKDVAAFLKLLQSEMVNQENDGQASPRFWAVGDYKWVPSDEENAERSLIFTYDDCEATEIEDYINNLEESGEYDEDQIKEVREKLEYDSPDDVLDWIKENVTDECHLVYEREEHVVKTSTFFLTKREAKEHIERNHYHYTSKVHTYAMTAWRSPQVETLYKILETFDWSVLDG